MILLLFLTLLLVLLITLVADTNLVSPSSGSFHYDSVFTSPSSGPFHHVNAAIYVPPTFLLPRSEELRPD